VTLATTRRKSRRIRAHTRLDFHREPRRLGLPVEPWQSTDVTSAQHQTRVLADLQELCQFAEKGLRVGPAEVGPLWRSLYYSLPMLREQWFTWAFVMAQRTSAHPSDRCGLQTPLTERDAGSRALSRLPDRLTLAALHARAAAERSIATGPPGDPVLRDIADVLRRQLAEVCGVRLSPS
jgi:hypothetical protein